MQTKPLFGPGGNSESFYAEGCKSTLQAPGWLARRGFDFIQTDWPLMLKMYLEQQNLLYR